MCPKPDPSTGKSDYSDRPVDSDGLAFCEAPGFYGLVLTEAKLKVRDILKIGLKSQLRNWLAIAFEQSLFLSRGRRHGKWA